MIFIDSEKASYQLRNKAIDLTKKQLLVTNFEKSDQEKDMRLPPNCQGFGRIRHFKLKKTKLWPENPLPILPAQKALGLPFSNELQTQVFQNAICNWRCWYCFVDYKLLAGKKEYSKFLSCDDLMSFYLKEKNAPEVIDLTGGQPDLTPEWIPWMMEALIDYGIDKKVFLWSDDNLSNNFFWKYLTTKQIDLVKSFKNYARVCCFKGIDAESFSKNTRANPNLFHNQFEVFQKLLDLGIDLYSYITLTSDPSTDFERSIPNFFDRIQNINEKYPLRIIPLEVRNYQTNQSRINLNNNILMEGQYIAVKYWLKELNKRYSGEILNKPITEINI